MSIVQRPQIFNASQVQYSSGFAHLELIDLNVLLVMLLTIKMTMSKVNLIKYLSRKMIRESAKLITNKVLKEKIKVSHSYLFKLKTTVFKLVLKILEKFNH